MLEALLKEIRQGGSLDVGKLAQRLDTSPQMVRAMLDHLQRAGILNAYESCAEACEGCGLSEGCSSQKRDGRLQVWQSVGRLAMKKDDHGLVGQDGNSGCG